MELPGYQPFYIQDVAGLRGEIARLALEVPLAEDFSPLARPLQAGRCVVPNRFCAQPIRGGDALQDGSPGELTRRRYRAYAGGGFGLIWVERTAVVRPDNPGMLALSRDTFSHFALLLEEMRAVSPGRSVLILQLSAAHPSQLVEGALMAREAGFDGVDLQCEHGDLPATIARVREADPAILITTRLCVYQGVRNGFGVAAADFRKVDLTGPMEHVQRLVDSGLQMLNVTSASPALVGPDRGVRPRTDSEAPDEHPLMTLERQLALVRDLRRRFPTLPFVGSGLSWLRHFVPVVAAGAVDAGWMDVAGFGRAALAAPDLPAQVLRRGAVDAASACMFCHACDRLQRAGRPVGCVLRDPEAYGPVFRDMRRLDDDRLVAGAARCHLCEAAPCAAKDPNRTDIPAVIKAFRSGRDDEAYALLRAVNPLPEMVSTTAPFWLEGEGACIETTLSGEAVPIRDLQYILGWRARRRGLTGVRIPDRCSGREVAVVGGGPTGIAAAVGLLELGHRVRIHESTARLGGVPVRLLAGNRAIADPAEEIEALLRPGFESGRLHVEFDKTLGGNVFAPNLLAAHAAVLVAVGLWKERSLGAAEGVVGGLDFLEAGGAPVPKRVAVLAGGDSAMDVCVALRARGAAEIYVVYGGPRAALHWHMSEGWFANPGVHAMMNWQPLRYNADSAGKLHSVQLRHTEFETEVALPVNLVVEAMGLEADPGLLSGACVDSPRLYTAGALVNGGASVGLCVAEGLAVADLIHESLLP